MTAVTAITSKKPSGPYWYWTELGPQNVNLADKTVDLPPGSYELFWDFRGKAGDTLQVTLTDAKNRKLADLADSISDHDTESWGQKSFKVQP